MPGPAPKPANLRQRRNKKAGAASLIAPENPTIPEIPYALADLPIKTKQWSRYTLAWWKSVWESPMAGQYAEPDIYGLGRLAALVEQYNRAPKAALLGEIRQQEMRFGLSPLDRARLQWEITKTEEAERKHKKPPVSTRTRDPRSILKAVK